MEKQAHPMPLLSPREAAKLLNRYTDTGAGASASYHFGRFGGEFYRAAFHDVTQTSCLSVMAAPAP